jgi:hypothetical protein
MKQKQEEEKQKAKRVGENIKRKKKQHARTHITQTGTFWRIRTRENHLWTFVHQPSRWEDTASDVIFLGYGNKDEADSPIQQNCLQEITDSRIQASSIRSEVKPGRLPGFVTIGS